MPRKSTLHPLLSQVIATLPPRDAGFPGAEREAWVKLFCNALDVVYGPQTSIGGYKDVLAALPQDVRKSMETIAAESPKRPTEHPFHVDAEGYARGPNGKQIVPQEIPAGEILWDLRSVDAGNLETVMFHNGSPPDVTKLGIQIRVAPR